MEEESDPKKVLNAVELVKLGGEEFLARIDTGAAKSSICSTVFKNLCLGPIIGSVNVHAASGSQKRDLIEEEIEIKGRKIKSTFNIADRNHMKYPILIGRNTLKNNFLIEVI